MNTTILIPQQLTALIPEPTGKSAKHLIIDAVERQVKPRQTNLKKNETRRIGLYFTSRETAILKKAMKGKTDNYAEFCSTILQTVLKSGSLKTGEPATDHELDTDNFNKKAETLLKRAVKKPHKSQTKLLADGLSAFSNNQILLGEAPTGSGKGLAIASLAFDTATQYPEETVVVSAPSFSILRQLIKEYNRISNAHGPTAALILGKQEFICVTKLIEFIKDNNDQIKPKTLKRINNWIESGGPSAHPESPYNWQVSELAAIAENFPATDFSLNHYDSVLDEGYEAYTQHKIDAYEANIIFCSHTMLAFYTKTLIKTKTGIKILPPFNRAIIDEAHLFHLAFLNAYSNMISLRMSMYNAHKSIKMIGSKPRLHKAFTARYNRLSEIGRQNDNIKIHAREKNRKQSEIVDILHEWEAGLTNITTALKEKLKKTRKKSLKAEIESIYNEVFDENQELKYALSRLNKGDDVRLDYSPIRSYPRIVASPKSIAGPMRYFWNTLDGAACISATLFVPKKGVNGYSAMYISGRLGIDKKRMKPSHSQLPTWATNPVTLYLPQTIDKIKKTRPILIPPTERYTKGLDQEALQKIKKDWYREVAACISLIGKKHATGGTLCLLTSYESVQGISYLLSKDSDIKQRLVLSSTDEHFTQTQKRYLKKAKNGEQPIWLGVGQCWTGIDLRLPGPIKQDLSLTDLIIPRLPLNTNPSHALRSIIENASSPFSVLLTDMALTLRQGIGRLVRQRGCCEKRIYLLDRRYKHPAFNFIDQPVGAILKNYTKREYFEITK